MATQSVTQPGAATQAEPFLERALEWTKSHRQITSWSGFVLVLGVVLIVWTVSSTRRSEAIAGRQLQGARYALDNQNLPLAASELARLMENYSSTNAAAEGRLVLAQVRLLQGQSHQAVDLLRAFAPSAGTAFRPPASELLGAAAGNLGKEREAAQAHQ